MFWFVVLINLILVVLFYDFINYDYKKDVIACPECMKIIFITAALLTLAFVCYLLSSFINPGFLRIQYNYVDLVSELLEHDRDLELLCTHCELIQTQTSFHCRSCNRCCELFDHHCPYLDNCLGYRNTLFFFIFLICYVPFMILVIVEAFERLAEEVSDKTRNTITENGVIDIIIIICFTIEMPLVMFQIYSQIKTLSS